MLRSCTFTSKSRRFTCRERLDAAFYRGYVIQRKAMDALQRISSIGSGSTILSLLMDEVTGQPMSKPLRERPFGRTGWWVSGVALGGASIGRTGTSIRDGQRTLSRAIDLGINLVDTAPAYDDSEELIGRWRSNASGSSELMVVTKCGFSVGWKPQWSREEIMASIERSLRHLRAEALDVVLLHGCDVAVLEDSEAVDALLRARDQGKARWIGYSGDNETLATALSLGFCDIVECSFNILDLANTAAIKTATERGIAVIAKRSIANGVPGAISEPQRKYAAQYWGRWQAFESHAATLRGSDWLQTAVRFSAHFIGISTALVGTGNPSHLAQLCQWVDEGPLPNEAMQALVNTFALAEKNWPALE